MIIIQVIIAVSVFILLFNNYDQQRTLEEDAESWKKELESEVPQKHQRAFLKLNQDIENLVQKEYPCSKWKFLHQNIGSYLVTCSYITIKIYPYHSEKEIRKVNIEDLNEISFIPMEWEKNIDSKPAEIKENVIEKAETKDENPIEKEETNSYEAWYELYFEPLMDFLTANKMHSIVIPKSILPNEQKFYESICKELTLFQGYKSAVITKEGLLVEVLD